MEPDRIRLLWITEGGAEHAPSRHRALIYKEPLSTAVARVRFLEWRYPYREIRRSLEASLSRRLKSKALGRLFSSILAEAGRLPFNAALAARILRLFPSCNRFIFQRCFPGWFQRFLLWICRKDFYFDFDDALFLSPPSRKQDHGPSESRANTAMADKMAAFIRKCRGVIVSNEYLADWTRRYNPRVVIVPTSVETADGHQCSYEAKTSFVLGWIGASENQKYLVEIMPAITEILAAFPEAVLHVVTRNHWTYSHDRVRCVDWDLSTYRQEIGKFHIGLAPLSDTPWTRGKMQFKAIQYAAQGVPVIGSSVGFNPDHWKNGINVLFAETAQEFRFSAERLLTDRPLRQKVGKAGLETIKRFYDPGINSAKLVDFIAG
jgi:glycosyltransferase involved in cell wall biosynthesis